jgi:hypothetical protein
MGVSRTLICHTRRCAGCGETGGAGRRKATGRNHEIRCRNLRLFRIQSDGFATEIGLLEMDETP